MCLEVPINMGLHVPLGDALYIAVSTYMGMHKREHVTYCTHMRRIIEGKICTCISCYYVVFKIC
jgi:hypothetical protein